MRFDSRKWPTAVRIRSLIADGERMEVHCYNCGRCRVMDPASLPLSPDEFVAGLGGRFRCTRCGSRKTEARGHIDYSKMFPGYPSALEPTEESKP